MICEPEQWGHRSPTTTLPQRVKKKACPKGKSGIWWEETGSPPHRRPAGVME